MYSRIAKYFLFVLITIICTNSAIYSKPINLQEYQRLINLENILLDHIYLMEEEFTPSASLQKYKKQYFASLPKQSPRPVSFKSMRSVLAKARFVYLGDEHTTLKSQLNTIKVLKMMVTSKSKVTLVIEWIDISFQKEIDSYLAGKTTLNKLRKTINFDKLWGFSWKNYSKILSAAKRLRCPILLVERLKNTHSLANRDSFIAKTLAKKLQSAPSSRFLVVYGDYHILGPNHLPEKAQKLGLKSPILLLGEAPNAYWSLLKKSLDPDKIGFAKLSKNIFYIPNGTPLERSLSYRNYLMNLTGWESDEFDCWVDKSDITPQTISKSKFDSLHNN